MPSLRESAVAKVTRLYPFLSGTARIANSQMLRRLTGPASVDPVWAKVAGGWLKIQLDDFVGRSVFFFGDLDPKLTFICRRVIRQGDQVLDIGANIGLLTVLMADLVGPNGQVFSFEPNPKMLALVDSAISRNGLSQVKLCRFALGDQQATLDLRVPEGNAGMGSLVYQHSRHVTDVFKVPIRTLDEVLDLDGVERIRLMKLDVEGFEDKVLA